MKKGILIVGFGSTYIESIENTMFKLKKDLENKYEDIFVDLAFTSKIIVEKLKKREIAIPDIDEALLTMINKGIKEIYLQPYLVIEGREYNKILNIANNFRQYNSNIKIIVGKPLLSKWENYYKVLKELNKKEEKEAIIYISHGTKVKRNNFYINFKKAIENLNYEDTYIQTLKDINDIDKLVLNLESIEKVKLIPLFLVAGNHVRNDIIYNKESWKNILESKGYEVKAEPIGLGEYNEINKLFIGNIESLLKS